MATSKSKSTTLLKNIVLTLGTAAFLVGFVLPLLAQWQRSNSENEPQAEQVQGMSFEDGIAEEGFQSGDWYEPTSLLGMNGYNPPSSDSSYEEVSCGKRGSCGNRGQGRRGGKCRGGRGGGSCQGGGCGKRQGGRGGSFCGKRRAGRGMPPQGMPPQGMPPGMGRGGS